jgi:hypothetical protein
MKKLLISIFLLISSIANSQTNLELTFNGIEPIIVEVDSLSAPDIYKKINNWIQTTYKNPEEVIKADIENEMIRISGYEKGFFKRKFKSGNIVEYDTTYEMTFDIKDNKYRVTFKPGSISVDRKKVLFNEKNFFDEADVNGNSYEESIESYNKSMNDLNDSVQSYIVNDNNW